MQYKPKIAFIGLGRMGFPMAGHLANAGYGVTVFNRTKQKTLNWVKQYSGIIAETPAEAAQLADIVFVCISRDQDVSEVALGPSGILESLKPQGVIINHSTGGVEFAKELAEAAQTKECFALDAPVAGGEPAAVAGSLAIMVGGEIEKANQCMTVLQTYAKSVTYMGASGNGQLMKMVNQVCLTGVAQGLAEALALANQSELDSARVLQVLSGGAARSFWLEYRGKSTVAGDFKPGFKVDLMRKDLSLVQAQAQISDLNLPTITLLDHELKSLQLQGRGDDDITAIIDVICVNQSHSHK